MLSLLDLLTGIFRDHGIIATEEVHALFGGKFLRLESARITEVGGSGSQCLLCLEDEGRAGTTQCYINFINEDLQLETIVCADLLEPDSVGKLLSALAFYNR